MQNSSITLYLRIAALSAAAVSFVFIFNNFLIFWGGWPGLNVFFAHLGLFWLEPLRQPLANNQPFLGWLQVLLYLGSVGAVIFFVTRSRERTLVADSEILNAVVAFVIRSAFWAVLFIGIVDMTISFMRIEGLLVPLVGEGLAKELGRAAFRGVYVHYPLLIASLITGYFTRTLGFT